MIRLLSLTILFHIIILNCKGQTTVDSTIIIDYIEIAPIFNGGELQLYCFLENNLDKEKLNQVNISGMAVAQFKVDSTGQTKDIKIVKSLNQVVDKELIRIIEIMPKWTPAKQRNKSIPVTMYLPLRIPYENKCCR